MQRSDPEIFFKLLETTTWNVLKPKFKVKKISPLKIWPTFKGLTLKLSLDFPPGDFDKNLQIVSCTVTERHRMKKLKISRSVTRKTAPISGNVT